MQGEATREIERKVQRDDGGVFCAEKIKESTTEYGYDRYIRGDACHVCQVACKSKELLEEWTDFPLGWEKFDLTRHMLELREKETKKGVEVTKQILDSMQKEASNAYGKSFKKLPMDIINEISELGPAWSPKTDALVWYHLS
eukprot:867550_1